MPRMNIAAFVPPHVVDEVQDTFPARLGWAVIQLWDELPWEIRDRIREQAGLVDIGPTTVQLDQQIGFFVGTMALIPKGLLSPEKAGS